MRPATIQSARSALATALAVVFYAGAIALSAWLILDFVARWQSPEDDTKFRHYLYFVCAFVIPWSIWPRKAPFEIPGPRLSADEHPTLFAMLRDVASATGQAMPAAVYLMPECNAYVLEADLPDDGGRQRVMAIGLPLFFLLPAESLRAIIAHEFGHYHGGDTRDAVRYYRIDHALVTTFNRVRVLQGAVAMPFLVYLIIFRAITGRLSRLQEFAADRLAASIESPAALARGLMEMAAKSATLSTYWDFQVVPALDAGYRPPIVAGFIEAGEGAKQSKDSVKSLLDELRIRKSKSDDTHPPLRARLAALNVQPTDIELGAGRGCAELLGPLEHIERGLLEFRSATALPAIEWEDAGKFVELALSTKHVAKYGKRLRKLRPRDFDSPSRILKRLARWWEPQSKHTAFESSSLLGCALIVHLHEQGWRDISRPGEPTTLTRDAKTIIPFVALDACMIRKAPVEEWKRLVAESGIAAADFRAMYAAAKVSPARPHQAPA